MGYAPGVKLLLVFLAACATSEAAPPDKVAEPNRPLTDGEVALLRPIFRDGIDYANVRVIDNAFPLQQANVYMTPRGHIYAPGALYRKDFSKAGTGERMVFVHEMTHVWQFANGMDLIAQGFVEFTRNQGAYEKAYPYELATGRDLTEYGMEQQASIVEDYFAITSEHETPRRITNAHLGAAERDRLYAAVLAGLFANARYARALDPRDVAKKHVVSSDEKQPGPEGCKDDAAAHLCEWRYRHR